MRTRSIAGYNRLRNNGRNASPYVFSAYQRGLPNYYSRDVCDRVQWPGRENPDLNTEVAGTGALLGLGKGGNAKEYYGQESLHASQDIKKPSPKRGLLYCC